MTKRSKWLYIFGTLLLLIVFTLSCILALILMGVRGPDFSFSEEDKAEEPGDSTGGGGGGGGGSGAGPGPGDEGEPGPGPGESLGGGGTVGRDPEDISIFSSAHTGGESTPVLRIYSDTVYTVYLRSTSYGDYTGTGWKAAEEYGETIDGYSMNYLPSFLLEESGAQKIGLSVEVYGKQYYVPYTPVMGEGELYTVQTSDTRTTGDTELPYSMLFYSYSYQRDGAPDGTLQGEAALAEERYREFVYDHYLDVPASTASHLSMILERAGLRADDPDAIVKVAEYVRSAASYDLQFDPALNTEDDRVVAFLETYKEGICQHFASSTVLLLRMLGIPARYTIGYAAATVAGEWCEVSAGNGHAWAEAYLDGVGWVYVESTASGPDGIPGGGSPGGENPGGGSPGGENPGGGGPGETPVVRSITVQSGSAVKEYDGTPLTADSVRLVSGSLKTGHRLSVEGCAELTEVGAVSNTFQVIVVDRDGMDVTSEYAVEYDFGFLEVTAKALTIETQSASKSYDGTPLVCKRFKTEGLLPGHTIEAEFAERTERGRCDNAIVSLVIHDAMGNDVTQNYSIEFIYGVLRVT